MNKSKKYGMVFGGISATFFILFGIKNYLLPPPTGLNVGTMFDFFLLSPTFPIWRLLDLLPKEPAWIDISMSFLITVVFWTIIGYGVGYLVDKLKSKND